MFLSVGVGQEYSKGKAIDYITNEVGSGLAFSKYIMKQRD